MGRYVVLFFATLLIALLLSITAYADECTSAEALKSILAEHDQRIVSSGIVEGDMTLIVVFATSDGSEFTLVKIDGLTREACIVNTGIDWYNNVPGANS
jgi:hypothetical protein